jgi:tRNA A-37 threonylcarbamoyl transferase component Bud32
MSAAPASQAGPELARFLTSSGLAQAGEKARWTPLTGGVSSDIWRVDLPGRSICVKRALAQLKVAAEWRVPTSRNAYEWAWMCFAVRHAPQAIPQPLAHDEAAGLFAMGFLDPDQHPVWKSQLLAGIVEPLTAASVGELLGRLHAASAGDSTLREQFDTTDNFHALRLDPYLLTTARRHPQLAAAIEALVSTTAATRIALVHGDVSPKNILMGPHGPVLLDAECAWYGDPAFDLAFCLNHLLLKCLVRPAERAGLLAAFAAFVEAYFASARFEAREALERRAAHLLPALLLARVDGKSPVEYITTNASRELVRNAAVSLIAQPVSTLHEVAAHWMATLASCPAAA